ncbi:hypothetical protein QT327_10545 [Olivibacter sp. 47]|uniref:hypothetical protein n=1 Tax=Olivibacter sp. 47 TaxID=3056486 RepID=UPI0025A3AA53|nr:hypothetical protein [Olivibacter sp. 47]MDM8174790.1 hypothetical protein [Olivibacter sp. 47]
MKVYTYYHEIFDSLHGNSDQKQLIEVWKENWRRNGWEPVVIGLSQAKENPKYESYLKCFSKFPSKNNKEYELACLLRWVAMEQIGEGFMSDYDVMSYGFNGHKEGDLTFYSKNMVPCFAYGTKQGWSRLLELFMSYEPKGKDHVSDQTILVEYFDSFKFRKQYMCPEYNEEGNWYEYPLVHFPYARTDFYGLSPRWKFVREFNKIIYSLKQI